MFDDYKHLSQKLCKHKRKGQVQKVVRRRRCPLKAVNNFGNNSGKVSKMSKQSLTNTQKSTAVTDTSEIALVKDSFDVQLMPLAKSEGAIPS